MLKSENINSVAIVGVGFIGPGIAQVFASKGYQVYLMDVKPEMLPKAVESIKGNLNQMVREGVITKESVTPILGRIHTTTDMHVAALKAQLVIEAVTENLGLKQNIFQELDSICPLETILATNTSVISISEIASKSSHRERILGTHFWNPPYLIPLVEVVKGRETSDQVLDLTFEVLTRAGKSPIKVLKDVPGFVANRLQHAFGAKQYR